MTRGAAYRRVMTGRSRKGVRAMSPAEKSGLYVGRNWRNQASIEGVCNLRSFASRPLHLRRHRGQDRVDIAAGLQSKDGAAVVEQVEFDITSAPDQLFLAVASVP